MKPTNACGRRGFSLVELLALISIFSLLVALIVPAIASRKESLNLGIAGTQWLESFEIARQTARTRNRKVEVRIYFEADKEGVQLFTTAGDGNSLTPMQGFVRLPVDVALSTNPLWSSILTESVSGTALSDARGTYYAFRYHPSGFTDLSGVNGPTLTLLLRKDRLKSTLPANFSTLRIDLQTGLARAFRPF